ncbi:MAG TPA: 3-oxoacyl-ACP reductase family protein [Chloroflexota bacterium]|jgi:NAD(P)-dependent dehydrogenase (short-subunit alcohol dehydrogenase family)|nr:3-oxoacyl-ACP reductase family protein [Chloroflexota bacterium]
MAVESIERTAPLRQATGPLRGKVAIITGASRGIGAAIARELGAQGGHLVLNYVSGVAPAQALAAELGERGKSGAIVTAQADIGIEEQARGLIQTVIDRFGRLDILINNAAITRDRTFRKMTSEEWREVIDTNLNGVFHCTHSAMPYLIDNGSGQVINISSIVALSGNIGQANYVASKAAIIGLTKTLALEWARYNVTVNCVAPGFIETDMLAKVPDTIRESITDRIPMRRFGTPEEVARLVRFLCTEGEYITGQVISVNGGLYM